MNNPAAKQVIRVLHIEAGRNLYGGAAQVQYLLNGLAEVLSNQNISVENHLICVPDAQVGKGVSGVATVHEIPMNGDLDFAMQGRIKKLIKQTQADVLHIHSRKGVDFWGLNAAKQLNTPCIITRRVDNREPGWFARLKYNRADAVVAISEGIERVLLSEGVNHTHLQTIRSVVDVEKFKPQPDPEYWQKEFGFNNSHFVIGVIAQLIDRKGHRFLLNIAKRLQQLQPSLRILILGKGPMREQLEHQVSHLGVDKIVSFAGFRSDIERILPNLDLVVHPALMEGLGVSLLQASACGVPVVAARAGGIPEAVFDEQTGLIFEAGDEEALYRCVATLIQDEALRQKIFKSWPS